MEISTLIRALLLEYLVEAQEKVNHVDKTEDKNQFVSFLNLALAGSSLKNLPLQPGSAMSIQNKASGFPSVEQAATPFTCRQQQDARQ